MKKDVISDFGEMVFSDVVMKKMLSAKVYRHYLTSRQNSFYLNATEADEIANAMKKWAVEKGATHYTHWFQPLTGITAEKHDSFVDVSKDGKGIMGFSGKELIKGEPDASSFPNGGIRNTFEARGYTAWDINSYVFIKEKVLYIPTAFCTYSGESLDKKTPLLRSIEALNREAVKLLRLCGFKNVKRVIQYAGPEQEYFLIDEKAYDKRLDLKFTGRTLFGARPIKGQELSDHYFGTIKPRIKSFMDEVNAELWRLGIIAKTEHNEVAPSQHELAVKFMPSNIATDQNQLIMELLPKIAKKHKMVCLLHEKPFDGINGSGKHNNWSIGTDDSTNLLSPGKNAHDNLKFLLFIVAVIKAVDDYQDLLRLSVATASNDNRLGGNEAPPAIISIFLGEELTDVLLNIEKYKNIYFGKKSILEIGVKSIPNLAKDVSDRNRTSPFAFTGNKFEFRMLGSSDSIACANIMLNSAVADTLRIFSEELEKDSKTAYEEKIIKLIKNVARDHKRIIFNGNGYDKSWEIEAKKRGLENLRTTPESVVTLLRKKNVDMLTRMKVYDKVEIESRVEILLDNYCKTKNIEAICMVDMVNRLILPSINRYIKKLMDTMMNYKKLSIKTKSSFAKDEVIALTKLVDDIDHTNKKLEESCFNESSYVDIKKKADYILKKVIPEMAKLRELCDKAELKIPFEVWPMPTYNELLFSI